MPFAIELALDAESAAPVRALWRRLAEAGIRFMAESGAEPHVSLVIWDGLDVERAAAEVAERLAAPPGGKVYGALSVLTQAVCDVDVALRVPPGAFRPPPQVESAVVRLAPRAT